MKKRTTITRHCEEHSDAAIRKTKDWIASRFVKLAVAMTMTATVLLFVSGCAKDGLSDGDTDRPLTFTVAPPPAWNNADGEAATRAATDPTTGKVSWEEGDVLNLSVWFQSGENGGGNPVATRYPKLIYTDGEWTFDEPLYWPLTAKSVIITATYVGTAPADGTEFIDQPVYSAVATADFGTTPEIGSGDTGGWQINCTAIGFTGLRPGQRLWLSGEGWAAISMFNGMISFSRISEPLSLMAGADGTATAYPIISNSDRACNIAVGAEAPVDVAGWTDIRAQLGTTGWGWAADGSWYTFDVYMLSGGDKGSGSVDPDDYMLSAEARRLVDWAAAYNAGTLSGDALNFTLREDVDLCEYPWTPVGKIDRQFVHEFDGGGHTIRGLRVNKTTDLAGLFGFVSGGAVRSVHVEGTVSGTSYVGGIAGNNDGGTIGGPNEGDKCTFTGSVSGSANVGGIVGIITGTVTGCTFSGTVSGTDIWVGGIVGYYWDGIATDCKTGEGTKVSGTSYVGGIAGYNWGSTVRGCETGAGTKVSGTGFAIGGIAGENSGTIGGADKADKCTFNGTVSGTTQVGGIAGRNYGGTVEDCETGGKSEVSATAATADNVGGIVGRNESTATGAATVTGCHTGEGSSVTSGGTATGGIVGLNKQEAGNAAATVIACRTTGTGMTVSGTGQNTGGIAGSNNGGTIGGPNVGDECTFTGTVNGTRNTGGIAGANFNGGSIGGANADNKCTFTGTVDGTHNTGGIVGNNNGTITNCLATGTDTGITGTDNYTGGIVGNNGSGTVSGCSTGNDTKVSGTFYVGGIAGFNDASITGCHIAADATITATAIIGGIVGFNNGPVENCYTGVSVTVEATGTNGPGYSYVGGIVGRNTSTGSVSLCYSLAELVTGPGDYTGGIAGANGNTVSQCFWLYADSMTVPNVAVGNGTATDCSSAGTVQGVINLWTAANAQP